MRVTRTPHQKSATCVAIVILTAFLATLRAPKLFLSTNTPIPTAITSDSSTLPGGELTVEPGRK